MTYIKPIQPKRPFECGDLVYVMNGDHSVSGGPYKVKLSTETATTIEGGRRYRQADGYWIGSNGAWPFPWLCHAEQVPQFTPEEAEQLQSSQEYLDDVAKNFTD